MENNQVTIPNIEKAKDSIHMSDVLVLMSLDVNQREFCVYMSNIIIGSPTR